jgi:hypothetical protein
MLSDVRELARRELVRRELVRRDAVGSIEELIAGATLREPLGGSDGKSGAQLERVVIGGEPLVLKHLHVDDDWTMRGFGDVRCRPVRLWTSGLLDLMPPEIDHATVGAAVGLGRNGWGAALLLHDVGPHLIPEGDDPIDLAAHRALLDGIAAIAAAFWGCAGDPALESLGLLPVSCRYTLLNPGWLAAEASLGWPAPVPIIASDGWERFAGRAPRMVVGAVHELQRDIGPLDRALAATPWTFLHGDWKMGNLGVRPDGRSVLLDWTYPGIGPVLHELGWYLALNRARLPESKEATIEALRACLEARGVATAGWWEVQLDLCLLGALVQFGWEKALGDEDELAWWCDRAAAGIARL